MSAHGYSEDALIEQPAIELFRSLKWDAADCFHEFEPAGGSPLGRETPAEVVLVSRLRPALEKLNPDLPTEAITKTIEELTRDRSVMSAPAANREIYRLIKDGVRVDQTGTTKIAAHDRGISSDSALRQAQGDNAGEDEGTVRVKVIDWENAGNNDYFVASQFWISGEMYKRRADLVGFVNGLPLVFVELKASHKRLEDAYNCNLRDYRDTIPQVFWFNAFIIVSNGSQSRIGSMTATWEHFAEWKHLREPHTLTQPLKWTPKFGPVVKLDFSGSAGHARKQSHEQDQTEAVQRSAEGQGGSGGVDGDQNGGADRSGIRGASRAGDPVEEADP